MQRKTTLQTQLKRRANKPIPADTAAAYEGSEHVISTGSTLLDLAISGGRFRGGGLPFGILVEIFGPSGCGKTVLLSDIAGRALRMGGEVLVNDPEGRMNKEFAKLFGLDLDSSRVQYQMPNTIPEVFDGLHKWKPRSEPGVILADSLAALSTDMEMADTDKMGMRRAKEFSEALRKTCRLITKDNRLIVCSNQVRINVDAGKYEQKYIAPGGAAIGFYASVRLRAFQPTKKKQEVMFAGKELSRVTHVDITFEVHKNSVWEPYRTAPVSIDFKYGIDDVRQNLIFLKQHTRGATTYMLNGNSIGRSIDAAIQVIESNNLEDQLKNEVIDLWEEIERAFDTPRKPRYQ